MKNTLGSINRRINYLEEKITELKDRMVESLLWNRRNENEKE